MTELLESLIDKEDYSEIVRDQIALILANESANQVALATTAGEPDPSQWKLRVYTERAVPWESWLNLNGAPSDPSPIVNVWTDNTNFNKAASDPKKRQDAHTTYNIDVYGVGVSSDNPAGGHNPGDEVAAKKAQQGVRLVRNILMAAINTYLQMQGTVGGRWPDSISYFQPDMEPATVQRIAGSRIAMSVRYNEFSPQSEPVTSEFGSIDITRAEDGMVLAEIDIPST